MIQSKPTLEYRAANDDFREVNQRVVRGLRRGIAVVLFIGFSCLFAFASLTTITFALLALADRSLNWGFFAFAGAGIAMILFACSVAAERSANK